MKSNPLKVLSPVLVAILLCGVPVGSATAGEDREQKQAELDAACEQAREKVLKPLREQYVEQCVQNGEQDSRQACEVFYSDYGAQSGNRAPLFYDLPECVAAFNYQNSAEP